MSDWEAASGSHLPQLDGRYVRQPGRILPVQRPAVPLGFLPELPKGSPLSPTSSGDSSRPPAARQHRPRPHTDQPKQYRALWGSGSRGSRSNTNSPLKASSPNFKEHRTKRRDMLRQALALLGAEPATPAEEQTLEASRCARLEANARLAVEMAEQAARKDLARTFEGVALKLRRAHRASLCAPTTPEAPNGLADGHSHRRRSAAAEAAPSLMVPPPSMGPPMDATLTVRGAHVAALNAVELAEEPCRLGVVAAERAARKTLQLFMTAGNPTPPPPPPSPPAPSPLPP
eukprot:EG_transcript_19702